MTLEMARSFFGWCSVVHIGLLIWWFLFFWLGHDLMYRFHGKLFRISEETFDAIHYAGMAVYKIAIFMLNLVPYLVLQLIQ